MDTYEQNEIKKKNAMEHWKYSYDYNYLQIKFWH